MTIRKTLIMLRIFITVSTAVLFVLAWTKPWILFALIVSDGIFFG